MSIFVYLVAFFHMIVLNCIHPINWTNCTEDPRIWLFPEVQRGIEMLIDPKIYESERELERGDE